MFSDADRHSVFFRGGSGDLIDSLSRSTDTESPVLEPRAGEEKELWKCGPVRGGTQRS